MEQFTANAAGALRRFAMAGVGAMTLTIDKSREIIRQLAARGEISAAEGAAACDELQQRLTEQISAFTRKLRADYEALSYEQLLARCRRLTDEQKQRLISNLTSAAESEPVSAGNQAPEPEAFDPAQPACKDAPGNH